MKKITLVILIAFLAINCSKEESLIAEENNSQSAYLEKRNEMNYVLINQNSNIIGDLQIYDDNEFLYFNCKPNSEYKLVEVGLYLGDFESLPIIKSNPLASNFNYFEVINHNQREHLYKINKKNIHTDGNKCAFISTYFKIINLKSNNTEIAWSSSNHLPSLANSKYYVYCIQ